jgi:hypothetical protein
VWGREVDGLRLTFHLAGINNQNFLMRDEETGTFWQQISGRAVSGPLAGKTLPFVYSDELTFGLWRSEQPRGTVLQDDGAYAPEYARKDWDVRMAKARTVIGPAVGGRELMLGVAAFGAARAFPYEAVVAAKLVQDHVGPQAVILVVGPDGQSVRVFRQPDGVEFYRTDDGSAIDSAGGRWDFQGCAADGRCLERVEAVKDYWFDWREYHPGTSVWRNRGQ